MTCPTKHSFTSNYSKKWFISPAAAQQSFLKLGLRGTAAGTQSGSGTAKAGFPWIWVFWFGSLVSNKA